MVRYPTIALTEVFILYVSQNWYDITMKPRWDCPYTLKASMVQNQHTRAAVTILTVYKTASFQKEAMRTQVALYFFYEVKFV